MDLVGLSEIEKRDHLQSCIAGCCSGFKFLWLHSLTPREVPRMPDPHSFICLQTRFLSLWKSIRLSIFASQFLPAALAEAGLELPIKVMSIVTNFNSAFMERDMTSLIECKVVGQLNPN